MCFFGQMKIMNLSMSMFVLATHHQMQQKFGSQQVAGALLHITKAKFHVQI